MERREFTISFFLPVHARGLASLMPFAGAWFLDVRDGDLRQLNSSFCSKKIVGDRRSPIAGMQIMEGCSGDLRQLNSLFLFQLISVNHSYDS
ncbi:hypothetical protein B9T19_04675 [Ignatzschineria sp. F8392]|uniref:hypothetical protein n=1 Tax=Ignatzschineria sp. F8392 TaxID=1980117 RepID=UPI000B994A5D|nr:hypothetical protein [Ignatzschineria sp. F8392]OYQ80543.1 hypothetical protein B9T19_04675 [Ignatzschineria sp. F8392]